MTNLNISVNIAFCNVATVTLLYLRINNRVIGSIINLKQGEDMSFKFLKYVAASLFLMAGFSVSTHAAEINQGASQETLTQQYHLVFQCVFKIAIALWWMAWNIRSWNADAAVIAGILNSRGASANLSTYVSGSGGGCAGARTDDFGNTTNKYLDIYGTR